MVGVGAAALAGGAVGLAAAGGRGRAGRWQCREHRPVPGQVLHSNFAGGVGRGLGAGGGGRGGAGGQQWQAQQQQHVTKR
ncbi:MAG: hypothetical protein WKG07_07385 [Hymenobacter sp.]